MGEVGVFVRVMGRAVRDGCAHKCSCAVPSPNADAVDVCTQTTFCNDCLGSVTHAQSVMDHTADETGLMAESFGMQRPKLTFIGTPSSPPPLVYPRSAHIEQNRERQMEANRLSKEWLAAASVYSKGFGGY